MIPYILVALLIAVIVIGLIFETNVTLLLVAFCVLFAGAAWLGIRIMFGKRKSDTVTYTYNDYGRVKRIQKGGRK